MSQSKKPHVQFLLHPFPGHGVSGQAAPRSTWSYLWDRGITCPAYLLSYQLNLMRDKNHCASGNSKRARELGHKYWKQWTSFNYRIGRLLKMYYRLNDWKLNYFTSPQTEWHAQSCRIMAVSISSKLSLRVDLYLFISKFERQSCKENKTNRILPSIHFHNRSGWARQKPAAKSLIWISQLGGRGPSSWAIFHCFPRTLAELDQKCSSWDPNQCPCGMPASHVAA